jgi:nitrous oxide reductase accessory protein NosL
VGNSTRFAAVLLATASLLAGCDKSEEQALQSANDSIAAARATGKTDLSNPEMGSKMSVSLTDSAMVQSHTEVPKGQLTVIVLNKTKEPHTFEMKGDSISYKTMPIEPSGHALLTVIVDKPGLYALACPDTGATAKGCRNGKLAVK